MEYFVQNSAVSTGKTNATDVQAVDEILKKLSVSQNDINNRDKIELPRVMTASNGTNVNIKWSSSNSGFLPVTGKVNKEFLGGSRRNVTLKALLRAGSEEKEKTFNVSIPVETVGEMLERAVKNIYVPESQNNLPSTVKVNVAKGTLDIPVTWERSGSKEKGLVATLRYQGVEYKKQF